MMNRKEFMDYIKENVKEYLPPEYENARIEIQDVTKANDQHLQGMVIHKEGDAITPTIYLDEFYHTYLNGTDIDSIVGDIADIRIANEAPDIPFSKEALLDYSSVKDKLQVRLCDPEMNAKRLENAVYTKVGDFAATYHVNLLEDGNGSASIMVSPHLLEAWKVTKDQLHTDALLSDKSRVPVFQSMINVLENMMQDTPVVNLLNPEIETDIDLIPDPMLVLTNQSKQYGASMMMQTDVMDKIGEIMKGDYYILPSSLHEVIVIPTNSEMSVPELNAMVTEINTTQVEIQDVLSNKVQVYDCQDHTIVNAVDYEKKHEKSSDLENVKEEKAGRSIHERLGEKTSEVKEKMGAAIPAVKKEKTAEAAL